MLDCSEGLGSLGRVERGLGVRGRREWSEESMHRRDAGMNELAFRLF